MDGYRIKKGESAGMKKDILSFLKRQSIWPILVICVLVISVLTPDFLSFGNLRNVVLQSSIYGIMGIGMTFLMINGFFDLSVGTVMGLCAALVIGLQSVSMGFAVFISLLVGAIFGCINGFLVTKAKINAFIVTLAAMLGARGLLYVYTGERAITGTVAVFEEFGASKIAFIPTIACIFLILLVFGEFILKQTIHGRNTYAIGGNYEAAANAGINNNKTVFINFVICSLAAALGGILLASRMNAATPTLGWPDTNLMVIASVVLGGTKLNGGYGGMLHTLGGVLVIGIIQNGMNLLNVQSYYNTLFMGLILILVVFLDKRFKPVEK